METTPHYRYFCGIDVAKEKHVAVVMDRDGQTVVKATSFANDQQGYQRLLARLKETAPAGAFLIGMEATGHYWYSLHDFLVRHGYCAVVLNPLQTAQQARQAIRKCKTDKQDAGHIATLLRTGQYKPALVPGALALTCRQLTRIRYHLIGQTTRLKQLVWSRLQPVWPEYEHLFADPFCATSRALLQQAPTPAALLSLESQTLAEIIQKVSRGKYGFEQARQVCRSAETSVGITRGRESFGLGIQLLLQQQEAFQPVRERLEAEIEKLATQLPAYLSTLPGASPLSLVSLYGEVDPIETFADPSQLVAFAGLDPRVFQTGAYDAPRRQISKRGSPFLRRTLWHMAHRAVYQEGNLRTFWLRKRAQQKHHLAAVTAVAGKLCHIVWRIMTDRRDYIPTGYNPKA
jgi:transposase